MFEERKDLYSQIEKERKSKLLVYVTGDRPGLETQMHPEVVDMFTEHLDSIGKTDKITLFLHSRGGETNFGWTLANMIRAFCENFEVIIPARAHSAATLLALGADSIMMTKQATLGPIDPSVNTPLNPAMPGAVPGSTASVSVESIKGFAELASEEFEVKGSTDMSKVLSVLAEKVHPLVLGEAFRIRLQIRMLAEKLLEKHFKGASEKIKKIVDFLCSDSGSHDYTINRYEATDSLELNIIKPDDDFYKVIKNTYDNIEKELMLRDRYLPGNLLGTEKKKNYSFKRALIESLSHGTNIYISEGELILNEIRTPDGAVHRSIQDNRFFEGWR
jgi:hypothetical protein